jgi:hypothetical protein
MVGLADMFEKRFKGGVQLWTTRIEKSNFPIGKARTHNSSVPSKFLWIRTRKNALFLFLDVETNTVRQPIKNAPSFDEGFVRRSQDAAFAYAPKKQQESGCCCRRVFRGSIQGGHSFWCGAGQKAHCGENHKCVPTLSEDSRDEWQDVQREMKGKMFNELPKESNSISKKKPHGNYYLMFENALAQPRCVQGADYTTRKTVPLRMRPKQRVLMTANVDKNETVEASIPPHSKKHPWRG